MSQSFFFFKLQVIDVSSQHFLSKLLSHTLTLQSSAPLLHSVYFFMLQRVHNWRVGSLFELRLQLCYITKNKILYKFRGKL